VRCDTGGFRNQGKGGRSIVGASVGGDAVGLWCTHCRSQTLDRLASAGVVGWPQTQ
jgi:hypothetical protein